MRIQREEIRRESRVLSSYAYMTNTSMTNLCKGVLVFLNIRGKSDNLTDMKLVIVY